MGTEVAISFIALRTQLENEKSTLYKIDENIKKIVQTSGRFQNGRFNVPSGDYNRNRHREGGRNLYNDTNNHYKNDDSKKTKTVFSRLSARVHDSDGEDDGPRSKRARVPSAVCRELPTRAAVLKAQGDDEQSRKRNRRIFGSLLGTLQKFKQEEIVLQSKEDKKAQVEKKIEEQARLEKEKEQRERKILFAEREHKKATIKSLEAKMARVEEFELWEASQKHLSNFILTKVKPHIYWIPKKMSDKANDKLVTSRKYHEKCLIKKRQELQEELQRIEQRCYRYKGPGMKENDPERNHDESKDNQWPDQKDSKTPENKDGVNEEGGRKRDKFAMDVDEKEGDDSDADDRHEEENKNDVEQQETETVVADETKIDSNIEENMTTKESEEAKEETLEPMETSEVNESQSDAVNDSQTDAVNDSETDAVNDSEIDAVNDSQTDILNDSQSDNKKNTEHS